MKKPIKITFANIKGGVGKSTSIFQIAAILSDRGYKILVVDCDPQGNISSNFFGDTIPRGINELLLSQATINDVIFQPYSDIENLKNIYVISSNVDLFYIEDNDPSFSNTFFNKLNILLSPIENNFDFILLDTNPSPNLTNSMAYCYTDFFIGVLDVSLHSIKGFNYLMTIIDDIKKTVNPNSKILGMLINCSDRKTNFNRDVISTIKDNYGSLVFETTITRYVKNSESQALSFPLINYAPNDITVGQYSSLVAEIIKRLKKEGRM